MGARTTLGLQVLSTFLASPQRELSGSDILLELGILSGTLYPILVRFEGAGLLVSRWEDRPENSVGRPNRRLYRITDSGVALARVRIEQINKTAGLIGVPVVQN